MAVQREAQRQQQSRREWRQRQEQQPARPAATMNQNSSTRTCSALRLMKVWLNPSTNYHQRTRRGSGQLLAPGAAEEGPPATQAAAWPETESAARAQAEVEVVKMTFRRRGRAAAACSRFLTGCMIVFGIIDGCSGVNYPDVMREGCPQHYADDVGVTSSGGLIRLWATGLCTNDTCSADGESAWGCKEFSGLEMGAGDSWTNDPRRLDQRFRGRRIGWRCEIW